MSEKYKLAWEKWLSDSEIAAQKKEDNESVSPYEQMESENNENSAFENMIQMQDSPDNPLLRPKDFNFWLGYSNFYLTSDICNVVSKSEGIESLDIVSPYRMRIAVGKMFQANEVMGDITKKVLNFIDKK